MVTRATSSSAGASTTRAATPAAKVKKPGEKLTYTYDASGRLATVKGKGGTDTYNYDKDGNLLSITQTQKKGANDAASQVSVSTRPPRPVVDGIGQSSAPAGASVTISGSGFDPKGSSDDVRIGTLFAHVLRATPTSLTVAVPPGSAGGAVKVTTSGGSSASGPSLQVPGVSSSDAAADAHRLDTSATTSSPGSGVTALTGEVRSTSGADLAGVTVSIDNGWDHGNTTTKTNRSGHFALTDLSAGSHQLRVNGSTAGPYGYYADPITLTEGRTNTLGSTLWLDPQLAKNTVTIPSPAPERLVVRAPQNPLFEVVIPKGTVITDHQGRPVTKLAMTAVPIDRSPVPLGAGMKAFYDVQPGDATVSGPGIQVVYPNASGQPPGTRMPYVTTAGYTNGQGWASYGSGQVSPDGTQIVPTSATVLKTTTAFTYVDTPPPVAPPNNDNNAQAGEPVDLSTGLFVSSKTDLSLNDSLPINLTRTYRQDDPNLRDFGMGMSDNYSYFVDFPFGTSGLETGPVQVVEPDGTKVAFNPNNAGCTTAPCTYSAATAPSSWSGSTLTVNSLGGFFGADDSWTLTLLDGTTYQFCTNESQLCSITDRFGNTVTIERAATGVGMDLSDITRVISPNGEWMAFSYASCGSATSSQCVSSITDDLGRTVDYAYDSDGRLISASDPRGGGLATTYQWEPCTTPGSLQCTEIESVTDARNNVMVTNTYNPAGQVSQQNTATGGTYQFNYTMSGGSVAQTTVTDPLGRVSQLAFDAGGGVVSDTEAAGTGDAQTTTITRDPTTELTQSVTDPLGRVTDYTYNQDGQVLSGTQLAELPAAQQVKTSYTYEPTYGRLTSVTDPLGHTSTINYEDPANQATEPDVAVFTDPMGNTTTVTTLGGQTVSETDALGNTTNISYSNGLPVAVTDPLGNTASYFNDNAGRNLSSTDPNGNTTSFAWDNDNELTSTTDPLGDTTSVTYDGDGDVTQLTDPNGNSATYQYNAADEQTQATDPLGHIATASYDVDGEQTQATDGNGTTDQATYDPLGRPSTEEIGVPSGGGSPYDTISYGYDAGNRLLNTTDTLQGTVTDQYDLLNHLTSQATAQGTLGYTYDNDGNRLTMTAASLPATNYSYDNDNNLKTITQGTSSVGFTYNPDNETTALSLPNGDVENFTPDADGEITAETVAHGSKSLGTLDYTFDANGNETAISGKLPDATLPGAVSASTYNADAEATTFNGANLTYDNDGHLKSDSSTGQSYTWNQLDELSSIAGGSTPASFTYDPTGRRATATFSGATNSYLYDGNSLIEDTQGGNSTTYLTSASGGATYQVSSAAGSNSLISDPIGSTVALGSSSGTSLSTKYAYSPSGVVTTAGASSSNTIEARSQQADPTGLDYSGAGGYYSPALTQRITGGALHGLGYSGGSGAGSGSWSCTNCSDGSDGDWGDGWPGGDGGGTADPKTPDNPGAPDGGGGGPSGGGGGDNVEADLNVEGALQGEISNEDDPCLYLWGCDPTYGWGYTLPDSTDTAGQSPPVVGGPEPFNLPLHRDAVDAGNSVASFVKSTAPLAEKLGTHVLLPLGGYLSTQAFIDDLKEGKPISAALDALGIVTTVTAASILLVAGAEALAAVSAGVAVVTIVTWLAELANSHSGL